MFYSLEQFLSLHTIYPTKSNVLLVCINIFSIFPFLAIFQNEHPTLWKICLEFVRSNGAFNMNVNSKVTELRDEEREQSGIKLTFHRNRRGGIKAFALTWSDILIQDTNPCRNGFDL